MQNYAELDRGWATPPTNARRKTAVITDDGAEIALVLLDAGEPATTGSRFSYRGRMWEICGSRHGSRVLVAEPAEWPRQ
jgi:hypothetical protein